MSDAGSYAEDSGFEDDEIFDMTHSSPPSKVLKQSSVYIPSPTASMSPNIRLLSRTDVLELQESLIADFIEVLPMTADEAFIVLTHYSWDFARVQEEWFENDSLVAVKCGLLKPSSSPHPVFSDNQKNLACGICLGPIRDPTSLICNHNFCKPCFGEYLEAKIRDSQDSVRTRCPAFKCPLIVARSLIQNLVSDEIWEKFTNEWCVNSLVMSLKNELKFCPNPNGSCDYIIHSLSPIRRDDRRSVPVSCSCGYMSCFTCGSESHLPATCTASVKWTEKNSSESQNVSWIIANTKPCPKCTKPIEKNQGCNHMTCRSCGMEFCWICLNAWAKHGGSFYNCNVYKADDSSNKAVEENRANAKSVLQKYLFHFERFMNHQKAGNLARSDLKDKYLIYIEILHEKFSLEIGEIEFIKDALSQVIVCRQVLKWTYVYAFYMDEEEGQHDAANRTVETRELFDFLQKNLEEKTDKLHELVEKDLAKYVGDLKVDKEDKEIEELAAATPPPLAATTREEFLEFRSHVCNYLAVTRNFCTKIVSELNIQ